MSAILSSGRLATVPWKRTTAAMTGAVLCFVACTASRAAESITLTVDGAPPYRIDRDAPGVTPSAWNLARTIQQLDQRLKSSAPIGQADDPELEAATRVALAELRNTASDALQKALEIQERTSGSLDATLMSSASGSAGQALDVLRNPPKKLNVLTEITASASGTFLQYVIAGELRVGRGIWLSYNTGVRLPVGVYTFRVCAEQGGAELYREPVNVLREPTKLMLYVPKKP